MPRHLQRFGVGRRARRSTAPITSRPLAWEECGSRSGLPPDGATNVFPNLDVRPRPGLGARSALIPACACLTERGSASWLARRAGVYSEYSPAVVHPAYRTNSSCVWPGNRNRYNHVLRPCVTLRSRQNPAPSKYPRAASRGTRHISAAARSTSSPVDACRGQRTGVNCASKGPRAASHPTALLRRRASSARMSPKKLHRHAVVTVSSPAGHLASHALLLAVRSSACGGESRLLIAAPGGGQAQFFAHAPVAGDTTSAHTGQTQSFIDLVQVLSCAVCSMRLLYS